MRRGQYEDEDYAEDYDDTEYEYEDDYVLGSLAKHVYIAFLITGFLLLFAGLGFGAYKFNQYAKTAPPLSQSKLMVSKPSEFVDLQGNVLAKVGRENRVVVTNADVPQTFKDALISTEDRRFYQHHGFDLIRIGKAIVGSLHGGLGASGGGSTLTQQYVKLSFLNQNEHTLKRKAQEVYLAFEMEQHYTKTQILLGYINKVYMGGGGYGVQTAAETYYGKPMKQLTVPQLAMLAGIPNNPNVFNPYTNPKLTTARRNVVLLSMYENHKLSKADYLKYKQVPITDGLVQRGKGVDQLDISSPEYYTYVDNALKETKRLIGENKVYTGGLKITVPVNGADQSYLQNLLTTNNNGMQYPNNDLLVSAVVLDAKTGRVIAEGGGNRSNYSKPSMWGYDFSTDIQRQAGSTMKPILAYAPAIQYLGYTPETKVDDAPYKYKSGQSVYDFDHQYTGNRDITYHLAASRNIPALKTMDAVGIDRAYEFANRLGMGYAKSQWVESGVLGGVANANPLKLAQAYDAFANGGYYNQGHFVVSIQDSDGSTLYTENTNGTQVMSSDTASQVTQMMKQTINANYGTAYYMHSMNMTNTSDLAGKTGTTNLTDETIQRYGLSPKDTRDSWLVVYNKNYVVALWSGYNTNSRAITTQDQATHYTDRVVANIFNKLGN